MKKTGISKALLTILMVICVLMLALAGCQSKQKQNASNQSNNLKRGQRGNGGGFQGENPAERQKKIQDGIQALVSDGTINQSQADKIIAELTSNMGGVRRRGNQQNGQAGNQPSNQQNNKQNDGQNPQQGQRQNRQRANPLDKLVSDGTITQAQADAVMQKIRGSFGMPQNNNQGGQF